MLYFMATGHPPFRAERAMAVLHRICHDRHRPIWEINRQISLELADVIDRLLEKKPSRRFASASDVQQVLANVLSRIQQPNWRRAWRGRRWLQHLGRRWQLVAAASIVLSLGASAWLFDGLGPAGFDAGRSSEAKSTPALLASAEILQTGQREFIDELLAEDRSLREIELAAYPETLLLRSTGESWITGIKAAAAEIARVEESWSVDPDDSLPLDTAKGENP